MLRLPMVCAQVVEHTARDVLIFERPNNWQNVWDTYWTERFATTGLENLPAKFWHDRIAEAHPTDEARQRAIYVCGIELDIEQADHAACCQEMELAVIPTAAQYV